MYSKGFNIITVRLIVICMLIGMWMPAVGPVTKYAVDLSSNERISADIESLTWDVIRGENTTADTITVNLVLPTSGANETAISWSVSPNDGTINTGTGAVTRPASDSEDKQVTLTATVSYEGGTNQTKDFILTVKKTAVAVYTVTYDANGGSGTAPTETDKTEGSTFSAAINTFTPPVGKQFKEWNTNADDSGRPYAERAEVTMPAANLTLYAIWENAPWLGKGSGTADDPFQVSTAEQLNAVRNYLNNSNVYFLQTADIDLSGFENWIPIGDADITKAFKGIYNGNDHTISKLTIDADKRGVGLFGELWEGTLENIKLEDVNIHSYENSNFIGALVGGSAMGTISNSSSTGSVNGTRGNIGGLVGANDGTISNSYSTCNVTGYLAIIGGLVGTNTNTISSSYSTGDKTIIGEYNGTAGGLVGRNLGTISNSYSTSSVTGELHVQIGGLVGYNEETVSSSYSTGKVTNENELYTGGLVGSNEGEFGNEGIVSSYYDGETSGQNDDTGKGTPKTTAEMKQQATYEGWDFTSKWRNIEGYTYPKLLWQPETIEEINAMITIDKGEITWDTIKGGNSAENNVTAGLNLLTAGTHGTGISWSATPKGWVNTTTGAVTRPTNAQGDKTVTLTATISKEGGTSQAKSFILTIKAQPATGGGGGNGGGSSSPSDQNSTAADGTVTRSVQNGQKVDQVTINETKATELIKNALNNNQGNLTIEIPASKEDPADQVEVTLTKETLDLLSNNQLSVTIETNNAKISIPTTTLSSLNQDVTFTIEQVKESAELKESDSIISIMAPNGTKLGHSLKIETNYKGKTEVTLPLEGINIPKDPDEQNTFLASLRVLVQHGQDDNEIVTGEIVYDQNNQPIGLSFSIERFSTFTILALPTKEQVKNPTPISIIVNDINGHWAEKTIRQLILKGAVSGYPDGTFKPNKTVTRAEFVAMLAKAIGMKESRNIKTFSDIQNHWAKNVIEQAAANGIVNGLSENQFGPNEEITREQMAVMIVNAGNLKQVDSKNNFQDSPKIATWAERSVNTAANYKIVNGLPNQTFNPKGKATRAEAATVIMNLLNLNN